MGSADISIGTFAGQPKDYIDGLIKDGDGKDA